MFLWERSVLTLGSRDPSAYPALCGIQQESRKKYYRHFELSLLFFFIPLRSNRVQNGFNNQTRSDRKLKRYDGFLIKKKSGFTIKWVSISMI